MENKYLIYLEDLRGLHQELKIDLYQVTGLAPTYTFPGTDIIPKKQCWSKVHLNWWIFRNVPFRVNYEYMLGDTYTTDNMKAINQLWLLEEAEIFKNWIDDLYPEEETKITQVDYPWEPPKAYELDFDGVKGSLYCAHPFWHYAMTICYGIDTTNNRKVN